MRALVVLLGAAATAGALESLERPVTKVVRLLEEMQSKIQAQSKEDEQVYKKLSCWCSENDSGKTDAIAEAQLKLKTLSSRIQELSAQEAGLKVEIQAIMKEIAETEEAMKERAALRKKTVEDFKKEEKNFVEWIAGLGKAIEVLAKHNMEAPESLMQKVKDLVHPSALAYLTHSLQAAQRKAAESFLAHKAKPDYESQSGEVFGMLRQMKETFESDLQQARDDDAKDLEAFETEKQMKEEQLGLLNDSANAKKNQLGQASKDLVDAKEDMVNTEASLDADSKFLMEVKRTCASNDQEYEDRMKARADELVAIGKALEILTGPDVKDLMHKSIKSPMETPEPEFLQLADARSRAAAVLRSVALRIHEPALIAVAATVKIAKFDKVIEAVDKMMEDLKKQRDDDRKHHDWCVTTINENERENNTKTNDLKTKDREISEAEQKKKTLETELEEHKAAIKELLMQIKSASEARAKESREYQSKVQDAADVQTILDKVILTLKAFYESKAFLQRGAQLRSVQQPADSEPVKDMEGNEAKLPEKFREHKKQSSGAVIALLEHIKKDQNEVEKTLIEEEKTARTEFVDMMKDANTNVQDNRIAQSKKQIQVSQLEKQLLQFGDERETLLNELQVLAEEEANLHKACDFSIRNFEVTQKGYADEIGALLEAKHILKSVSTTVLK